MGEPQSDKKESRSLLSRDIPLDKAAFVASIILAAAVVVGIYIKERVIDESSAFQTTGALYLLLLFGFVLTCILYFIINFLYKKADAISGRLQFEGPKYWRVSDLAGTSFFYIFKKRGFVILAILIVAWLPWFIIRFPGNFFDDTIAQLGQYYGVIEATDHHPYFDTLIFGAFWDFGNLFGSWQVALASYAIVQSVATAASLSAVMCYLIREGAPRAVVIFLVAFVAIFPSYPLFAQVMLKDCLNGWVFILFALMAVEAFRSKGKLLRRWPMVVAFVVVALLCCLTKKTGQYVVVPTLIVLFIYVKGWRLKAAAVVVAVVALVFCWSNIALPAMNIGKGEIRETLSLPVQQTARYVYLHEKELTDEDWEVLDGIFEDSKDLAFVYNPSAVDTAKNMCHEEISTEALVRWASWLCAKFTTDPLAFLEAPLGTTWRYYYPVTSTEDSLYAMIPYDTLLWHDGVLAYMTSDVADKYVESAEPDTQIMLQAFMALTNFQMRTGDEVSLSQESSYMYVAVAQIIAPLSSMALYAFWIPIVLLAYFFRNREWKNVLGFVPIILFFCSLMLVSNSIARFVIPFLYTLPLYLGLAFCANRKCKVVSASAGDDVETFALTAGFDETACA